MAESMLQSHFWDGDPIGMGFVFWSDPRWGARFQESGSEPCEGTCPYSGAQMDPTAPGAISVIYALNILAPYARHVAHAMGKVALGTCQIGRHGATVGPPYTMMSVMSATSWHHGALLPDPLP